MTGAPDRRKSLREQQKQFTHERLISVAEELFREKGYLATTIDDIAAGAGTTRATFYLHFANKNALLVELSTSHNDELAMRLQTLDQVLERGELDEVRAWLDDSYDFLFEWFERIPFWDAAAPTDLEVATLGGDYLEQLLAMFPSYVARTGATTTNRDGMMLMLLLFTFERLVHWSRVPQWKANRNDQIDVLASVWHAMLRA